MATIATNNIKNIKNVSIQESRRAITSATLLEHSLALPTMLGHYFTVPVWLSIEFSLAIFCVERILLDIGAYLMHRL